MADIDELELGHFLISIPELSIRKQQLRDKLIRFKNHLVSMMDDFSLAGDVTYTDDWGRDQHLLGFEFTITEKVDRQFTVFEIRQRFGSRIKLWIGNENIVGVKVIRFNSDGSVTRL